MPIIEGRAPLIAFVSDLVGEAALEDAAADTAEDAALFTKPTICDAASAPSVERLAWACYRLLDSDVQDLLEEYEGPRTAVRGPFGKTLRAVYDGTEEAGLAHPQELTSQGLTSWLSSIRPEWRRGRGAGPTGR